MTVQYVGMDVDKQKIVLARLGAGRDTCAVEHVIANTPGAVKKYFTSLLGGGEIHATYEAGCFGFGLYRQLSAMGVTVVLAAPGLIPRKPADRIKTDRRDAHSLAMALRAGQLTGIHVPTEQDESVRDYLRMYESLRGDLRICKQRVLQFLLRRGISYGGGGPWAVKHRHWLSALQFPQARDRQTLDMYLSQMQELEAKCTEAAAEVESIAAQDCYRQQTKKLTAFKGIKTLIALSFVTTSVTSAASPTLGSSWPIWAWSPRNAPVETNAVRVESPKRAIVTCGVCLCKPPGTTVAITPAVAI